MFDINKIIEKDMELYNNYNSSSRYVVLSIGCARDILTKMSLYEILYTLRCRNIISTSQFRSVRGQLQYKTDEVIRFIRNKLLEKYGETLLLNNKWKEACNKSSDVFIYDRVYKKLLEVNKMTAIDIRLGQ